MPNVRVSGVLLDGGDHNDIGVVFDQYYPKVVRYLYYKVGDMQIAEDMASEVFVRLVRNVKRDVGIHIAPAWLFTIAHNLAVDHFRSSATKLAAPLEETIPVVEDSTETTIDRILDSQAIQNAIKALSEDQAEVILLRFINNLSITDTAVAMGRSETAIKALQRRALLSLRKFFSEREVNYV